MRCIEIHMMVGWNYQKNRLTLTWDVLKSAIAELCNSAIAININMRCIEMELRAEGYTVLDGLTLTWDVLKCKGREV